MVKIISSQEKILRFLREYRGQKFYLRELAQRLRIDPGNLSRELRVLLEKNRVTRQRLGRQTYFSLRQETIDDQTFLSNPQLRRWFKKTEPELIKFCQSLIRIPSVSGEDPEEKIAQFIYKKAIEFNLTPQIVAKDKHRPNLVIEPTKRVEPSKPGFLLVGHMDTVGPGEIDNWRYYPFSGHVAGGRLYGRGAQDMKAGISCQLFTLKLIKDLRVDLPVSPRLLLVSNEEGGSKATPIFDLGMEYLIEEGFIKDAEAAVYGYGGSYNVGIGHRGVLRIKVATYGEAIHTGSVKWQRKEKGSNAVTAMAEILLALEDFQLPKLKHASFPKHGNVITPGTMILHGGSAVSTVPDFCESVVEVRYLPGLNIKKVYHEIKEITEKIAKKRGIKVELTRFVNISAVSLAPSEKIAQVVAQAAEKIYGRKIGMRGTGPANESYLLIKKGIPTVVFGPMGSGAHADNEFVYVDSLLKTIKVYLLVLRNFGI